MNDFAVSLRGLPCDELYRQLFNRMYSEVL